MGPGKKSAGRVSGCFEEKNSQNVKIQHLTDLRTFKENRNEHWRGNRQHEKSWQISMVKPRFRN